MKLLEDYNKIIKYIYDYFDVPNSCRGINTFYDYTIYNWKIEDGGVHYSIDDSLFNYVEIFYGQIYPEDSNTLIRIWEDDSLQSFYIILDNSKEIKDETT